MRSKLLAWCSAGVVIGTFALGGCERRAAEQKTEGTAVPPAPRTEPTGVGGGPVTISSAVDKLVEARCDRELKCGNVGADKKFADRTTCVREVERDFSDDINAEECRAGIDSSELNECLAEARNENCNNPFDSIERIAACRKSDICVKSP